MRIALLNMYYYPQIIGGAEISVQKLAETLAKDNEVFVICAGDQYTIENINGVTVVRMPLRKPTNKVELFLTRFFRVQIYASLKRVLKEISPDVLHVNNLNDFTVLVWMIAHQLGIPVIQTLRDYHLLSPHHKHDKAIVKYCSRYVDAVTAPSKFTLNHFLSQGMFVNTPIKKSIANAIDCNWDKIRDLKKQKEDINKSVSVKMAYLGRLSKEKGIDWLVRVFANSDLNGELHIYGNGDLSLETQAYMKSRDKIYFHGFLSQSELRSELEQIDVIVAPSLWDEPFGRIILDGYISMCPSIITNRGGMPEVVDHYKTGYIVKSESDQELLKGLEFYCDRNHIVESFEYINRKLPEFTMEKQCASFQKLYTSLIQQKGK